MDARVIEALAFMELNSLKVEQHAGAAFAEYDILKTLSNEASAEPTILAKAHLAFLNRGVPDVPDRASVYMFTHHILFASDFGRIPLSLPGGYPELIESLVEDYENDTDVLGELLMCAKCIGYSSPTLNSAMTHFKSLWDALDRSNFAENYHPILVGGLLFAMG